MKDQHSRFAARPLPADRRTGRGFRGRAVGAFLPKVVAAAFERYGFHSAEIMTSWETIVGSDVARLARPQSIKWPRGKGRIEADEDGGAAGGATLIVACEPAFALEVAYRKNDIIDRINRYFGYRAIGQLRLLQAVQPMIASALSNAEAQRPRAPFRPVETSGDLASALEALGGNVAAASGSG